MIKMEKFTIEKGTFFYVHASHENRPRYVHVPLWPYISMNAVRAGTCRLLDLNVPHDHRALMFAPLYTYFVGFHS